jgi:hypothetical protein
VVREDNRGILQDWLGIIAILFLIVVVPIILGFLYIILLPLRMYTSIKERIDEFYESNL